MFFPSSFCIPLSMKLSKEGQCKGRKIPGCMGIARFRVSIAYHPGWGSYNSGSIKEIPEHAALRPCGCGCGRPTLLGQAAGTATLAELVCRPPAGHSGHTTLAELAVVRRRAAGS